MSRNNTSSYFPLKMIDKRSPDGIMFGPSNFKSQKDSIYPKNVMPMNETIIWIPAKRKSCSLSSYRYAHQHNDPRALGEIQELGIPLNIKEFCS